VVTFFCDSSAIVKRYMAETGSAFVDGLADLKSGKLILLARITRVEVTAAIARRLKGEAWPCPMHKLHSPCSSMI
jgi:uncharacterized protein